VTGSFFALDQAMRSFSVFAGTSFLETTICGLVAIIAIGSKSFSTS